MNPIQLHFIFHIMQRIKERSTVLNFDCVILISSTGDLNACTQDPLSILGVRLLKSGGSGDQG